MLRNEWNIVLKSLNSYWGTSSERMSKVNSRYFILASGIRLTSWLIQIFQPKILFRRAESVAERMLSAWFSFLMYKFVRCCAGKQLYQLYWATKQQTEKGPQDALTMDARYSLSEEKLLRASLDFRELTVIVVSDSGTPQPIYDTQVRVLDCDTISQVWSFYSAY